MSIIEYLRIFGFYALLPFLILFVISFYLIYKSIKDKFSKWTVILICAVASFVIAYLINLIVVSTFTLRID